MLPLLVLAIGVWLASIFAGDAATARQVGQTYRTMVKANQLKEMSTAVTQVYQQTGNLPASIAAIGALPGFEHLRSAEEPWQGYTRTATLNDGVWQYTRAGIFSRNPGDGLGATGYFALNTCGTGSASTASSWCGAKKSTWYRIETRESYNDQISRQRVRMNMLLQKLGDHFNVSATLPDRNFAGGALAANSVTRISALVNYGGLATNCAGTFTYMNSVPIDCEDMFDIWGGPVGYQFITNQRIILVSESPITNNLGAKLIVAATLDASGL